MSLAEIKNLLRSGAYAWPGGYPLFFVTRDGAALCFDCTRAEWRNVVQATFPGWARGGWRVEACAINWEDTELTCDHCNKRIESAYGMNGGHDEIQA